MTTRDMEKKIARRIVKDAIQSGHGVSVFDGEEWTVKRSTSRATVILAMFSTDSDRLAFWKEDKKVGWVDLVYGNGGWDVISDHADNEAMAQILEGANQLSDKFQS